MFKALLVDDEEWIRLGLREQIEWSSLGIEIIGEAPNGLIALEMVEKYQPDIILSDIRMPRLDGIQLMEAIYQKFPHIIIIVISGYSDFEYARKAISFHVFDYILKPIEEEKLEETLLRAVQKLREENHKKEDLLKLNRQVNENGTLAKERFLTHLVQGSDVSLEELQNGVVRNGLHLAWPRMVIVVFKAENFADVASSKYKKDVDLAGFVLYNVIHELIQEYDNTIVFKNYSKQDELVLIKGFDTEAYSLIVEEIYARCKLIIDLVRNIIRFELYIGIGSEFASIKEACRSYNQAVEAMQNIGMIQGNRIQVFERLMDRNFIVVKKKSGTKKMLDEIVDYLNKQYGEEINLNSVADHFHVNPAYLSRIFKSETGQNFNEYLNQVRMDAAVKLLMQDNFKINDISERVGYGNVSYFLKRFKGYFGCTPSEFKKKKQ